MVDLEQQLRRYADQVERTVAATRRPAGRSRRYLVAGVAAALVLGIVLLSAWPRNDDADVRVIPDRTTLTTTTVATTTAPPVTTESTPSPPLVLPLDPGPLSPRERVLLLRGEQEVLVWGGEAGRSVTGSDDFTTEYYGDGAVLDLVDGTWRSMAPSPLPAITQRPLGLWVDGRAFVIRDRAAAFYDLEADTWEEVPPAPFSVWELVPIPELGAIAASGEGGVAVFDPASSTWSDTGAGPADAFNRRIAWTGQELVSVWGSLIGAFPVETWTPDNGWVDRGVVDSGVSQVAIEIGWIDGEIWIIGYDMTVDAWDPATGTSRSLPPLPIVFQEGSPVLHSFDDGTLAVQRNPGLAIWTGDGWEVAPEDGGFQRRVGGVDLDGEPALWSFGFDHDSGQGNRLRVSTLPVSGELDAVQIGSFELTIGADESLLGQGMTVADTGRVFDPWADLATPDGDCRLTFSGGNLTQATVHILIGARALIIDCGPRVDPARFLDRISDRWASGEYTPTIVDRSASIVPSVIALFYDTAEATLRNAGFVPVPQFVTVPFGDPQVGVVVAQSPDAFTDLPPGSEVVITVGEAGPPPD